MARGLSVSPALFMRLARHARALGIGGASPPPPPPPPPPATFIGDDSATSGAWKGTYGSKGYYLAEVAGGQASLPSWASVTQTAASFSPTFAWDHASAQAQNGNTTGAFQSAWFATGTMTFEIDQSVNTLYDLSVYLVNPHQAGIARNITIAIEDTSGNVLDGPRAVTETSTGDWYRWAIFGSIKVVIAFVSPAGSNAVTQGFLFD